MHPPLINQQRQQTTDMSLVLPPQQQYRMLGQLMLAVWGQWAVGEAMVWMLLL
jgi:hypothetical protein